MGLFSWIVLITLSVIALYQIFYLDKSLQPMLAEKVDFNIKKPEKD